MVGRLQAMADGVPDHVLMGCLQGMAKRPDSRGLLADLDLPALVIVGAEDRVTPPEEARALATALPRAQLVVVPNSGHTPTLEQPAAVGAAMATVMSDASNG